MKSHALQDVVIGLYESLLKDFQYIDPAILGETSSVQHLRRLMRSRGLAIFTIALPDIAKYLEQGLRDGRLPDVPPPCAGRMSATDSRPRLLFEFWARIFDEGGILRHSPCTDAIAGLRQLLLFAKKLRLECSEERTRDALTEFVEVDASLPRSHDSTWLDDNPTWVDRHGHPLWGGQALGDEQQLNLYGCEAVPSNVPIRWERFRDISRLVLSTFGEVVPVYDLMPKHGPGAVSDDVPIKYVLPHWPAKLASVFPADWFASHDFVDRTTSQREYPSKVLCVPKTQKGPRIIAAEPTSHQWCQQAVLRWFVDAVGGSCISGSIDFRRQDLSQGMALRASIDGSLATVDLSAASDRLSTRLVEYVFQSRRDVLDVLHATRTRTYRMPDGSVHIANKFAVMGSACTFPVQTVVFTIFAVAAVLLQDDRRLTKKLVRDACADIRVFGDDIILPTSAYSTLVNLLTEAGLKVNAAKSHGTGLFREACGLDAYSGVDVTPAYLLEPYDSRKPESLVSVIACSNNFHRKGLWHAASYLLNTVDPKVRKVLRVAKRDVSQPCVFSYAPSEHHLKVRFNPDLQVLEVRALVLDVKVERKLPGWEALLLQFFSERGSRPLLEEVLESQGPERSLGQAGRPKGRLTLRWVLLEDRDQAISTY